MTHIWVPKVGIIEGETSFNNGSVAGQYTLRKYKTATGKLVQELGPFDNLITNQGLDRVGAAPFITEVYIGTGTAAPAVTDVQLASYSAYTSSASPDGAWNYALAYGGAPDYWVQGAGTWRFSPGTAVGTFTEVGVGWRVPYNFPDADTDAERHRVSSRALIVDSGGSPISITVLPDEYLDVTYSLKHYPYTGADVVQTIVISGVSYTFTSRSLGVSSAPYHTISATSQFMRWGGFSTFYTGTAPGTPPTLATITSTSMNNQGAGSSCTQEDDGAYVPGSYTRNGLLEASLTQCNLAYGLRAWTGSIGYNGTSAFAVSTFQTTISPAIPKDNTKVLQFGISVSWSRK